MSFQICQGVQKVFNARAWAEVGAFKIVFEGDIWQNMGGSMKKNRKLFGLAAIIVIIIAFGALKGTKQNTFPQVKIETEIQADSQEISALVEETISEAESNRLPEKKENKIEESKQLPKLI